MELTSIIPAKVAVPGLVTSGKGKALTLFPEDLLTTSTSWPAFCPRGLGSFEERSPEPQRLSLLLLCMRLQKSRCGIPASPRRNLMRNNCLQPPEQRAPQKNSACLWWQQGPGLYSRAKIKNAFVKKHLPHSVVNNFKPWYVVSLLQCPVYISFAEHYQQV